MLIRFVTRHIAIYIFLSGIYLVTKVNFTSFSFCILVIYIFSHYCFSFFDGLHHFVVLIYMQDKVEMIRAIQDDTTRVVILLHYPCTISILNQVIRI